MRSIQVLLLEGRQNATSNYEGLNGKKVEIGA